MNIEEIKKLIDDHIDLITVDSKSLADSRNRAAKFLVVASVLSTYLKDLEIKNAKFETIVDAQYAQAILETSGKNITEKKIQVAQHSEYCKYKDALSELSAQYNWVKTHYKIFENAHLFFRQLGRDL